MGRGGDHRGRKLVFQTQRTHGLAEILSRANPRCGHSRLPQIGAAQRARTQPRHRPLHIATQGPPPLGHRAALRQRLRHLCLVRCANQLCLVRRLSLDPGRPPTQFPKSLDQRRTPRPPHWQGHPRASTRHLLALHAARDGLSRCRNAAPTRPRLVEHPRRKNEQITRQHRRSKRARRKIRSQCPALLPHARHRHRQGRRLRPVATRDALQHRARQRIGQPLQPRAQHDPAIHRRHLAPRRHGHRR